MNDKTKERLAQRSAYVVLSLLLVTVLTLTVIAIVATINQKPEELPPEDMDGQTPPVETPPDQSEPTITEPTTPPEETPEESSKPTSPVYVLPTEGYVQKDYLDSTLVFSGTMNDYRVHLGVDLAGNIGDPVYNFAEGTVESISDDPFMGKTIVIKHQNGITSKYMNLANELPEGISVGSTLTVGTVIGAIGETALSECAEAPHLHFEVWANGKQVNPSGYVTFSTDKNASTDFED